MAEPTANPSIGDVVHYVARGSADGRFPPACRAATVTELDAPFEGQGDTVPDPLLVGLCVMNPSGLFFHPIEMGGVPHSHERVGGTWHWPEPPAPPRQS